MMLYVGWTSASSVHIVCVVTRSILNVVFTCAASVVRFFGQTKSEREKSVIRHLLQCLEEARGTRERAEVCDRASNFIVECNVLR